MSNKRNIELEYKFWVKDKKSLIKVLNSRASTRKPRQHQSNVMFDNPAGLMQKTDGRIRVRTLGDSGGQNLNLQKTTSAQKRSKKRD